MLTKFLRLLLLVAPCAVPTIASAAVSSSLPSPNWPGPADHGGSLLRSTALRLHNDARRSFGVVPVAWSEALANEARDYARTMATTGLYGHDRTPGRRQRMGETLWRGSRGVFSYETMIGVMVDEGRLFRPGVFPAVSATRNWADVAHFTQSVWPTTTEIGCGLASSGSSDYLVCRYAPTGNKDGVLLSPSLRIAQRGN